MSRFKLLDPFEKEDKDIFFGRGDDIKKLYKLVHQSSLTLVYGLSGTGKTSLVQCGLANHFTPSEWHDIYIRRHDNINQSLQEVLQQNRLLAPAHKSLEEQFLARRGRRQESTGAEVTEAPRLAGVSKWLNELYMGHFKPIYLIFDQFEELFILGEGEERHKFYDTVENILSDLPFCRLIFIMREESLGELIEMEKRLPSLYDNRMRIEPISRTKVEREVIPGMCKEFGIELEDDRIPAEITGALTKEVEKKPVELTYLQVFLNRLDEKAPEKRFTHQLIQQEGNIDDVLADFLQMRIQEEQKALSAAAAAPEKEEKKTPPIPEDAVERLLNPFATLQGTKQPLKRNKISVAGLTDKQVGSVLDRLVDSRILSQHKDEYELAHDALARHINDQRSAEEVTMIKIVRIVRDRYETFGNPTKTYLTAHEVDLVSSYRDQLKNEDKLEPEEWKFVEKSTNRVIRQRFLRLFFIPGVIMLAILLLGSGLGGYVIGKYTAIANPDIPPSAVLPPDNVELPSDENAKDLVLEYWKHFSDAKEHMAREDFEAAGNYFEQALDVITTKLERESAEVQQMVLGHELVQGRQPVTDSLDRLEILKDLKNQFDDNLNSGQSAIDAGGAGNLIRALDFFKAARDLHYPFREDSPLQNIEDTKRKINDQITTLKNENETRRLRDPLLPEDQRAIDRNNINISKLEAAVKDME